MSFHLHRWSKWKLVDVEVMYTGLLVPLEQRGQFVKTYQQRECLKCGKVQQVAL